MKPLRLFSLLALCAAILPAISSAEEPAPAARPDHASVTLYSAKWCGYCTKARDYLNGRGIAHREIDIESDGGKTAFSAIGGTGKGVPLLVAGDRQVRGFSTATYDTVFAATQ